MAQIWNSWCWQLGLVSSLAIGGAIAFSGDCAFAQPIPDSTLPNNSRVTPQGTISLIEGGTQAGTNLFHSFTQFSVPTEHTAYFNNVLTIQNIISRVTGGSTSNIDGTLKTHGTANLFLINPNGIIFGPNARLDIGGSFLASTASSLLFADGTEFSATAPQATPLLTISVPIGLQFGETTGEIQVQKSRLAVQPGKTLVLVGGAIAIKGGNPTDSEQPQPNLVAPGGRIELGSVAGVEQVSLYQSGNNWRLGYDRVNTFKTVRLEDGAYIEASGFGGGSIQIQGARLDLTERSFIFADTQGAGVGGEVLVQTTQAIALSEGSRITTDVLDKATGIGGDITIETGQLRLQDNSLVRSRAVVGSEGLGGNLTVSASDSVELDGSGSSLSTLSRGTNSAGNLTIVTRRLSVQNGAQVRSDTTGEGQGENLTVSASDSVELLGRSPDGRFPSGLFTQSEGSGNAGNLTINTRKLIVGNGAQVSAATFGQGNGGNIQVNASDAVNLFGVGFNKSPSGLFTRTARGGQGGNIVVDTNAFRVADNAVVDARTITAGNGGNITVKANTFEAVNGGQILASAFSGSSAAAGNITVNATDITISGSAPFKRIVRIDQDQVVEDESATSGLFVLSRGLGDAGKIDVTARSILLDNQGELTAESNSGQGGNISLQVQDLLQLRGGSKISTTAGLAGAGGNGGNIEIDAKFVLAVLSENSDITANAFQGDGGNIQIKTQGIFGIEFRERQTSLSDITASSEFGVAGVVDINTPDIDPSRGLATLPVQPVTPEIVQACTPSDNRTQSEFVITGRGGLPPTPSEALSNDPVEIDWVTLNPEVAGEQNVILSSSERSYSPPVPAQIVEAQGWTVGSNGKLILTAFASPVNLHSLWQTPVECYSN